MDKYQLTELDIQNGINRFLMDIYSTVERSEKPELVIVSAGPGAGKTGVEIFYKKKFKDIGEKVAIVNSDKIAMYHPNYEEALEELPDIFYKTTRQFVRPASSVIYKELREKNINIINENTLDKGESDMDMITKFKEAGYSISVNIVATDIYIARLACFQREAKQLELGETPRGISKANQERMYNAYVKEVYQLQDKQLIDEVNVYTRGKNISTPNLIYTNGDNKYKDFYEAIQSERDRQRKEILNNPEEFLNEIKSTEKSIIKNGVLEELTNNALKGLKELKADFLRELTNEFENTKE